MHTYLNGLINTQKEKPRYIPNNLRRVHHLDSLRESSTYFRYFIICIQTEQNRGMKTNAQEAQDDQDSKIKYNTEA